MISYKDWLHRAFLLVEARICEEFADPLRHTISEEYVRIALMRGLITAAPAEAHRVRMEGEVPLHRAACITHTKEIKGKGRALAADIAIEPPAPGRQGLICELKWLKNNKKGEGVDRSNEIVQDLWKLALSRSTGAQLSTYILIGGDAASFSKTLKALKAVGPSLLWSPAGRGAEPWPKPTLFSLGNRFIKIQKPLVELLKRNKQHRRMPPPCWWTVRLSLQDRWYRTLDSSSGGWRIAMWEVDHHGLPRDEIDWDKTLASFQIKCG
jgi:hypothetical protein